ncbi:hypothetical protein Tco_0629691 [Tanacetum coccineum]|uniref:Uncharacterized protein n=1 Tax=Tanacetum coccineum TaxID=301880 RepID=A0ABQ4WTW7_9ASTR
MSSSSSTSNWIRPIPTHCFCDEPVVERTSRTPTKPARRFLCCRFPSVDDRDFHCCDSGWRNVLFCHLTIEFFLFRVSTQALIPLVGSFSE